MNNRIFIIILFVIESLLGNAQTSQDENWQQLVLPKGWYIVAPKGFYREDDQGVDSYVGTIYSVKDSITLQFDIVVDNNIVFDNIDCSLNVLIKKARQDLRRRSIKQTYNIPRINRAYVDTVNGRVAMIIVPKKTGVGLTYILISDCSSRNSIAIKVNNLPANKQDLVLKIFKFINRCHKLKNKLQHYKQSPIVE